MLFLSDQEYLERWKKKREKRKKRKRNRSLGLGFNKRKKTEEEKMDRRSFQPGLLFCRIGLL